MNRAGDAAFLLAMFLMIGAAGTVEYAGVAARWTPLYMTPVVLMLGFAAAGKSAQLPLYTWLPDAMEGPTPVSALIHAATMVTAGVYLLVRSAPLIGEGSPVILWTGLATALLAGVLAAIQRDIKRVLAYSTVSQLGLMFVAIGAGAWQAAILHLLTHAFFKALLFLGAGSVIHGLGGEQDLAFMGGLRKPMPWTFRLMLVASLAIMGMPGFSGFFSKEPILAAAFHHSPAAGALTVLVSGLTAFYIWRLVRKAFLGEPRSGAHAHESPLAMLAPMAVLGAGSVVAGWGPLHIEWPIAAAALLATLAGAGAAQAGLEAPTALRHLHILDWLWTIALGRGFALGGGRALSELDGAVIDGAVNGSAFSARAASRVSMFGDRWVVDGSVRLIGLGVRMSSYPARLLQSGWMQSYALVFLAGVALILGWTFTR
jgi:NADH-quinone oxidoreductase subunit L